MAAMQIGGYFNCYKDRPWGYLESEEYIEHYGTSPVWSNYRRNQKGGIPSQKTRNTCIVGVTAVVLFPGLLPFQVPHVDFSGEDYSNSHYAVGSAPPPPTMTPWYRWYHTIQPETEVAQVKKSNEAHLT
nr:28S ribosomal protein S18b, mitochondrial-like [Oncorhynchus nerka]